MIHLLAVRPKRGSSRTTAFPFSVPAIRSLRVLRFESPITFFVGENGSGKSTLLEAIALAATLPTVGTAEAEADASLESQRRLGRALTLEWGAGRSHRGFFLRAEDFFGFQRRLTRERAELSARLTEIEQEYRDRDRSEKAKGLAKLPYLTSLAEMERRYGLDPDARSHGEAFLNLFRSRFVPGGLYLMDEPEAALSPQNQLGLIAMLLELIGSDAQFIIATHSPIVMAAPGAAILSFDGGRVRPIEYRDVGHVKLTRDFLTDPERFLRRLAP
jgi:predicted ATPase